MGYKEQPMKKRRFFTEERFAGIVRWWSAAAVYFFIGWGTGLGAQNNIIDFVFYLGVGIGVMEMFVVMPIIRNMFNTREGFYWRQKSLWQKVSARLQVFFKSLIIMILVVLTYDVINVMAIKVFALEADQVFLPGEPIIFGLFYLAYYTLITGMVVRLKDRIKEA